MRVHSLVLDFVVEGGIEGPAESLNPTQKTTMKPRSVFRKQGEHHGFEEYSFDDP